MTNHSHVIDFSNRCHAKCALWFRGMAVMPIQGELKWNDGWPRKKDLG